MGRGVRSRDDRCAVILLDPRLTQLVARADLADRLSPATRAQLQLSRQVSGQLANADMSALVEVVDQVLRGDAGFRKISREALVGVGYGPAHVSTTAEHLRKAYNAAAVGRAEEATTHASAAVRAARDSADERLAGWLGETLAGYLHAVDVVRAQQALASAAKANPAVLRPLAGLAYQRVTASAGQAKQASDFLSGRYATGTELVLGVESVLAAISWDDDHTDETEAALADLAEHFGLPAQRPEQTYGRGSDVLWALGEHHYAVVEAKSGATGDLIWKREINQLAGSANWCRDEYGTDASVVPVMMHVSSTVEKAGTPPPGTRVITPTKLDSLKTAVRAVATALASGDGYRRAEQVADQVRQHGLTGKELVQRYTVAVKRQTC